MANIVILFCCLAISSITAAPASNEQLDKATVNDIAVNTVEDNANIVNNKQVEAVSVPANSSVSTVEISGITTGAEATPSATPAVENTPFKPQRAGSMFARFIDDIFQIPIMVLQNVARLITSPFTQARKNPEVLAPVS
ncbi:uncharacterized protein LOC108903653 [Anoplophora glabripennis]|uniref:uncharacterized protein LOC108903653 n=1 Tax=Anoplophora glabripennis TaxID=217634 RepID=UPI000874C9CA|nr:uncharacterized protein LOC108903653 [Anoplophora glabripennis]